MKQNKMRRCAGGSRDDTEDSREGESYKEEEVSKEQERCGVGESRCRCGGSKTGTVCHAER